MMQFILLNSDMSKCLVYSLVLHFDNFYMMSSQTIAVAAYIYLHLATSKNCILLTPLTIELNISINTNLITINKKLTNKPSAR